MFCGASNGNQRSVVRFLVRPYARFFNAICSFGFLDALDEVNEAVTGVEESVRKLENFQKVIELERDLIGVKNLVQAGREFIREGCLQKIDRKGPQPRMFFMVRQTLTRRRPENVLNNYLVYLDG
ncbi:PREDICTED: FERM, RhoGEF and pleckstrin domain-containing protein 2-like [Acropora digitifera]|uniref:FERM, RhoGEF and pleckstrin domain-containing protein 2-like n=1 Tax=Acropora digitifera TaxID=70779 RepID=UPI000779F29D|nr:PREDICTED: FERM, RhoGEF and pleckstrin domain-containing protein 2-like [Acropora digitifera]